MKNLAKRVVAAYLKKQAVDEAYEFMVTHKLSSKGYDLLFAEAEQAVTRSSRDHYCDHDATLTADGSDGDFEKYYSPKRDLFIFGGNGGVYVEYDEGGVQDSGWAAYIALNRKGKVQDFEVYVPECGEGAYIEDAQEMIMYRFRDAIELD